MSIVKRQHYVWRQYLRAWSTKESICTLLKEKNEVRTIKLMGVAQERYFYRLQELSISEIELLEGIISKSHSSVQGLLNDFLFAFKAFTDISQKFKNNPNEKIQSKLREIEINTLEKIHGKFESDGSKLISCRSKEDLEEILSNSDNKYSALIFLCVQYYRTQNVRKSVIKAFKEEDKIDVSKIWNMVSLIMSFNTARNIALDEKLRIRYFHNQTMIPFVTGDQPVLNIKQNEKDQHGNVKNLEFFYPLSPQCAISVHFEDSQNEAVEEILVSQQMVDYFNDFFIQNSLKFSFCDNEEYLNKKACNN